MNSTRCDTYKYFKTMLNPEKYLTIDMPFYIRRSLARFRCSSHKLLIETGRHLGIPRQDRICVFCLNNYNRSCIEDEYHVFFVCERFNEERQRYISPWFTHDCNFNNFCNIMQTQNDDRIKCIAFFVHEILKCKDND